MTRDGDWWVCSCGHRTEDRKPGDVAADGLARARERLKRKDSGDGQ